MLYPTKALRVVAILTHEEITKRLHGAMPERYVFEDLENRELRHKVNVMEPLKLGMLQMKGMRVYSERQLGSEAELVKPPTPDGKRVIRNPATWGCMDNDGENQD